MVTGFEGIECFSLRVEGEGIVGLDPSLVRLERMGKGRYREH